MDHQSSTAGRAERVRCTPVRGARAQSPAVRATLATHLAHALGADGAPADIRAGTALLDRFLELLTHRDLSEAHHVVDRLLGDRVPPDQILTGLFTPAAQRLGELWEDDARSFVDVTVATGHLQELLRWMSSRVPVGNSGAAPEVLLVTPSGDDHTFGALLFQSVLRFRGWAVVPMAPFEQDLDAQLARPRVAVLGLSLGSVRVLPRARTLVARARRVCADRHLVILAGGPLAVTDPEAMDDLPVDGVARDAEEALEILSDLVPRELRPSLSGS